MNIVYRLHVSAVDVAVFTEVHYKGLIHRSAREVFEAMRKDIKY